jgi:hypothetical protein
VLLLCLAGCTSVDKLADTMNKRNISSCLTIAGAYPPFLGVSGLVATGQASIASCRGEGPFLRTAPPVERAVPPEEPPCSCD